MKQASAARSLIFLDTSSLLASCWNGDDRKGEQVRHDDSKESTFWNVEVPNLAHRGTLILPLRNRDELVKHSNSSARPLLACQARHVISKLEPLVAQQKIEIVGDVNDPFADAILLSVALKFRTQHSLWFITQDNALARDLHAITKFESVQPRGGQKLEIRRVSRSGRLEEFRALTRPAGEQPLGGRPASRTALSSSGPAPTSKASWLPWKRDNT